MVYVDASVWPYGRMTMCHMLADSIEELHNMADKLGLVRRWFQGENVPHYDICKSKRALAIQFGAVEINRAQTAAIMRAWRSRLSLSGDERRHALRQGLQIIEDGTH